MVISRQAIFILGFWAAMNVPLTVYFLTGLKAFLFIHIVIISMVGASLATIITFMGDSVLSMAKMGLSSVFKRSKKETGVIK